MYFKIFLNPPLYFILCLLLFLFMGIFLPTPNDDDLYFCMHLTKQLFTYVETYLFYSRKKLMAIGEGT